MASLLSKFRIDYSDLKVITDITKKPQDDTVSMFETLIKDLMSPDNDDADDDGGLYCIQFLYICELLLHTLSFKLRYFV